MNLDLLIENGTILTMSGQGIGMIPKGSLGIKDGAIACVGDSGQIKKENSAKESIDATGKVVMPGFVNTHTHSCYGMMSKGILTDIMLFLEQGIAPYFSNLDETRVYYNSCHHVLEGIKRGVTTVCDMGSLIMTTAKVYEESGVRGRLSEMVREMPWDYSGVLGTIYQFDRIHAEEGMKQTVDLLEKYGADPNNRISAMTCFQAADYASEELMLEIYELAKKHKAMIHTHLTQSLFEIEQTEMRFGCRPVELLDRLGMLNSNTLAAHLTFCTPEEIKLCAERGVKLANAPYTWGRKGFITAAAQYLHYGGIVGIGSDDACYTNVNPISDMKTAHVCAQVDAVMNNVPRVPLYKILRMHTVEAAKAVGLGDQVGSLDPGKRADVIILDISNAVNMQPVLLDPLTNIPQNIVVAANGSEIETVIVDGEIIMENHVVKTLDEKQIMTHLNETAQEALLEAYEYYKGLPDSEIINMQKKLRKRED